jgi:oleate hydratase
MDITGHYQNESIFRPIYLYLYNLGVDFLFDTKVTDIVVTAARDGRQRVSRLSLIANGFQITKEIDTQDIVIMMLGSTVSGSSSGTNSHHPVSKPIEPADELDENWALWLELETNQLTFGNPYNFCTRLNESILASFTITTADSSLWEFLVSIADHSAAGTMIMLQESNWKLRLCIPTQPVFSQQPRDTYVIWGFMLFPRRKGNYVQKLMEQCSGAEILTEVLGHLGYPTLVHHTMTIPRLMPRMTSMLLVRSMTDRPEIVPANSLNFGFIGQFVEIPRYSSVDISYGIRTAQVATSRLMGIPLPKNAHDDLASTPMNLLRLFYWK